MRTTFSILLRFDAAHRGVVSFMEQRHFLSLARANGEEDLAKRISDANRFKIRITNMIRESDPTSQILLRHYRKHYANGSAQSLADLLLNICFCRNTMSRQFVKLVEQGGVPWLRTESDRIADASAKAADEVYLKLDGKVFFGSVQPMKDRSKNPRRGWGELVSELVNFARKAGHMAQAWKGERAVDDLSAKIRSIAGFGGKGFMLVLPSCCQCLQMLAAVCFRSPSCMARFRMKEILLDLAEMTRGDRPEIADQMLDFGRALSASCQESSGVERECPYVYATRL